MVLGILAAAPPTADAARAPGSPGADEAPPSLIERGAVWEVGYRGRVVTVRASKGLVDLAALLASPGREHHCLDLSGAGVQDASTGDVIDTAARRAYETRIRDLQEEVDDAELAHDLARAERAQAKLDVLVDHLTTAIGRGGRTRRASATAERARSAVTQRVRGTMRQLADVHPELGRHLRASINTGLYCSYTPAVETTWHVERASPPRT
jgi:hypothetical protein